MISFAHCVLIGPEEYGDLTAIIAGLYGFRGS